MGSKVHGILLLRVQQTNTHTGYPLPTLSLLIGREVLSSELEEPSPHLSKGVTGYGKGRVSSWGLILLSGSLVGRSPLSLVV